MTKPTAVAYLRCSTSAQDTSIAIQRDRITAAFADRFTILRWYIDDGKSGSKDTAKRIDFLRMMDDLTTGAVPAKVVLCFDLSRFGRLDSLEGATHKADLRTAGVKLVTINEGVIDWSDMTGRIIDTVLSEGNAAFSRTIGKKGLDGKLSKIVNKVKTIPCGGHTPYGLARQFIREDGSTEIYERGQLFRKPKSWRMIYVPGNPREVECVLWLFEQFDSRDTSYRQLAEECVDKGFPQPTPDAGWNSATVRTILRNPIYTGTLRYGFHKRGRFYHASGSNSVDAGTAKTGPLMVQNICEGIVPAELWASVARKIERKFNTKAKPQRTGGGALNGVVYCGQCGGRMHGIIHGTKERPDFRYRCNHAGKSGRKQQCGFGTVSERFLLPYILDTVVSEMDSAVIRSMAVKPPTPTTTDAKAVESKIRKLDGEIERGQDRLLRVSDDLFAGVHDALKRMQAERKMLVDSLKVSGMEDRHAVRDFWQRIRSQIIYVDTGEYVRKTIVIAGKPVAVDCPDEVKTTPGRLREALLKAGVRLYIFLTPRPNGKGWHLAKGELRAKIGTTETPCWGTSHSTNDDNLGSMNNPCSQSAHSTNSPTVEFCHVFTHEDVARWNAKRANGNAFAAA